MGIPKGRLRLMSASLQRGGFVPTDDQRGVRVGLLECSVARDMVDVSVSVQNCCQP